MLSVTITPSREVTVVFGQCKDMTITFVNRTGETVDILREGHRVKNPGGLEGFNNLTLGGPISDLADDASKSTQQTLNIKCVDDAVFEIHYTRPKGPQIQTFNNVNIEDKNATLTLTR
jgi:hypothetical protein